MFGSFHFGIFVFSYFGHFSCMIFFTMCSVCLFFPACLAMQDKQKITMYFCIFVTSLTKMKNKKWNEINFSFSQKIRLKLKFTYSEKATKFCKISTVDCLDWHLRWRFFKILWPSQNTSTLPELVKTALKSTQSITKIVPT